MPNTVHLSDTSTRVSHLVALLNAPPGHLKRTLDEMYGRESAEANRARYLAAIEEFAKAFGPNRMVQVIRAPGRINTIGEHTDYNALPVGPAAIDHDIIFVVSPKKGTTVSVHDVAPSPWSCGTRTPVYGSVALAASPPLSTVTVTPVASKRA